MTSARLGRGMLRGPHCRVRIAILVTAILLAHVVLAAWGACAHSPTFNEIGHVPAGLSHWQYGMFHLYRVNPPVPRMAATLPLLLSSAKSDWSNYGMDDFAREEIPMGIRFASANGTDTFRLFTIARLACIPFSVLGALICYRWAAELWGLPSGLMAMLLWCFNPTILGHAPLVMPDVPAAAMSVASAYSFWKWLREPLWTRTLVTGCILGCALLCKTTLLSLIPLFVVLWILIRSSEKHVDFSWNAFRHELGMLAAVLVVSLYVVNLGYAFTGSFQRIETYRFQSRLLGGDPHNQPPRIGNRLSGTWIAGLPSPVPRDFLLGIDQQRTDFEKGDRCYLGGEWKQGGWWYFYLYGLLVKTPLATIGLFGLASATAWTQWVGARRLAEKGDREGTSAEILQIANADARPIGSRITPVGTGRASRWTGELCLVAPAVGIFLLVSSQTNYTNHFRYILPAFPFLFVWTGRVAVMLTRQTRPVGAIATGLLVWSTASSLMAYPHSVSYFNELAGGPANGHEHLLDSNVAWGQDLLYLKRWLVDHPQARPIGVATIGWIDPRLAGIESTVPPIGPNRIDDTHADVDPRRLGPLPGWFVIDANFLHGTHWPTPTGEGTWQRVPAHGDGLNLEYFQRFKPVDRVGYSMFVYHVTSDEVKLVRGRLGLPPLDVSDTFGRLP